MSQQKIFNYSFSVDGNPTVEQTLAFDHLEAKENFRKKYYESEITDFHYIPRDARVEDVTQYTAWNEKRTMEWLENVTMEELTKVII